MHSLRDLFCVVLVVAASAFWAANSAQAAETKNRLASNRLASNRLASNRLASNRLASNRLASNSLSTTTLEASTAAAEMLSNEDGRWLFSYIVSCALPLDTYIVATVDGAPDTVSGEPFTCVGGKCTFSGALGLAEYWTDHRLAPKDQRWVSACLLARVNAFDTADAISLRGPHDNLTVSSSEVELYTVQEGAFFGNIFGDPDAPIDWNACRGQGDVQTLRVCTQPDPNDPTKTKCGFNFAGDCADYTLQVPSPYACKTYDAQQAFFDDCHAAPGDGIWPALKTYREVITTYTSN